MMRLTCSLVILCGILSGCVGTKVTGRDVDTSKPHPSLHSVPDRPKPADFTQIDEEREDFEEGHEHMLHLNTKIRESYHAPAKDEPEDEIEEDPEEELEEELEDNEDSLDRNEEIRKQFKAPVKPDQK
jgi:hypothetical protein